MIAHRSDQPLTHWFAAGILLLLAACGGGGASTTAGTTAQNPGNPTGNPGAPTNNTVDTSIVWQPAPILVGKVSVVSPDNAIAAGQVVTFGQTFPAGEIAAGAVLQASADSTPLPTQTDIKRHHPDGSIRHAIVSVRLPAHSMGAGTQAHQALSLSSGAAATGATLSLANLTSAGSPVDYRVVIADKSLKANGSAATEAGREWSITLKAALNTNATLWLAGPLASEWRARAAPLSGSDAHPGLRVIFDARYNSSTQGRVSIAIENVESTAARGDRIYDISIYDATTGGTLLYHRENLKHYAHTRVRKILYFGSGNKEMLVIPDVARLKASRTIPNYVSAIVPETQLANRYSSWQASKRDLFEESLIRSYMPATGGRPDIGPLPGWTALALISGDPRMYQIMFDQAERSAYFNVHWRDSLRAGANIANADVFSIDVHPQFSLFNPSAAADAYVGSSHYNRQGDVLPVPTLPLTTPAGGWTPDRAHQPSLTFLPYVITGDRYYLDELNFWAAWNLVNMAYDYRLDGQGLLKAESQSRGQAWAMRTMGHAAWIAPTGAWHSTYFTNKLENNFNWFRNNIMPGNPLGYWHWISVGDNSFFNKFELPNSSADTLKVHSPWMHNFVAYTLYELCEKGFSAQDLRDMTLGYTLKLFTSGTEFNRLDGTSYRLPAELTSKQYITTMTALNQHSFSNKSYAERNPAAGASPKLESAGDPNGYASIALATMAAAIDVTAGDTTLPSSAYVFIRDHTMTGSNSQLTGHLIEPAWNIVPFGPVVGLGEAPGIYPK